MTHLSHITSAIAISQAFIPIINENSIVNMVIITIFAIWPDINLLWHRDLKTHHFDWTHYPIFPITILVFLILAQMILRVNLHIGMLFSISWIWHIFLDTFGIQNGVRWFWPISDKEFSFTKLTKFTKQKFKLSEEIKYAFKNGEAIVEILIISLGLVKSIF